ncbi:hypothetical protein AURANDRAFT_71276, partial [Aureococcus anophagefferens]
DQRTPLVSALGSVRRRSTPPVAPHRRIDHGQVRARRGPGGAALGAGRGQVGQAPPVRLHGHLARRHGAARAGPRPRFDDGEAADQPGLRAGLRRLGRARVLRQRAARRRGAGGRAQGRGQPEDGAERQGALADARALARGARARGPGPQDARGRAAAGPGRAAPLAGPAAAAAARRPAGAAAAGAAARRAADRAGAARRRPPPAVEAAAVAAAARAGAVARDGRRAGRLRVHVLPARGPRARGLQLRRAAGGAARRPRGLLRRRGPRRRAAPRGQPAVVGRRALGRRRDRRGVEPPRPRDAQGPRLHGGRRRGRDAAGPRRRELVLGRLRERRSAGPRGRAQGRAGDDPRPLARPGEQDHPRLGRAGARGLRERLGGRLRGERPRVARHGRDERDP